jgi:hypothetical protein
VLQAVPDGPAWPASIHPDAAEFVALLAAAGPHAAFDRDDRTPDDAAAHALAAATGSARPWQNPDEVDRVLAVDQVRRALDPLAGCVAAEAPAWWSAPVDLTGQQFIEWVDPDTPSLSLGGAAGKLDLWRAGTLDEEARAVGWAGEVSGSWWSAPCLSGLPHTTRLRSGAGPVGLSFVEDGFGWTSARSVPVVPTREPRVLEITGPEDWVELVARYPCEVHHSRRHDWRLATGLEASWRIPDYRAVAGDFDAVHLTVRGYLTASGVALGPGPWRTVLAGWAPDATYWLTDCLAATGPPQRWATDPSGDTPIWTSAT